MTTAKLKCAVYTRKSSDEGLEQDFNSLDAQREACEAFITSQASLGWKVLPKQYDDGGLSGGHMERPALQSLLDDIKAGRINVVVVYKIDRLTRSLMDFARMVEIFDAHEVSFVSVTQQFNTTTSMGRLTLNVLLSFAQFEREVTAERIRDKFAASRKKGIWMGGRVPLGYDIEDKRMIVNQNEAQTIEKIFDLYLESKNVRLLKERCDDLGIVTKVRKQQNGIIQGGKPFTRGNLYEVLQNPIYIGKVRHKDQMYEGQHDAIIGKEQWEAVQSALADGAAKRCCGTNVKSPSLLIGLVYDETGDRLSTSHSVKNGRRYRYYISFRLKRNLRQDNDGWRLPAAELEGAVTRALHNFLSDEVAVLDSLKANSCDVRFAEVAGRSARMLAARLNDGTLQARRDILHSIIDRITVQEERIEIAFNKSYFLQRLGFNDDDDDPTSANGGTFMITASVRFKRRGVEAKIILGGGCDNQSMLDERLVLLVAKAHVWFDALSKGKAKSIPELAKKEGVTPNDISRILHLAFLKPSIVERILAGTQPTELTAQMLKRVGELPIDWQDQEARLGFASA